MCIKEVCSRPEWRHWDKNTDLDVVLYQFAMYKVHNEISYTIEGKSVITHSDNIGVYKG